MPPKIKKDDLIQFYKHIKLKADNHWKNHVQSTWDRAGKLYRDEFDFGDYKPEEQNVSLPIADNLVTRLASVFSRALVNLDGDYFTISQVPDDLAFAAKGSLHHDERRKW